MRKISTALLFLLLWSPGARASDVKLESLADFDPGSHFFSISIEEEAPAACRSSRGSLERVCRSLFEMFGIQVAPFKESHLEFAVSVKGFTVGEGRCGLKITSMARQVPQIAILRISPGSDSTRYRLWSRDQIVNVPSANMQAELEQRLTHDLIDFSRTLGAE